MRVEISQTKSRIWASAIRLADTLSRVKITSNTGLVKNGQFQSRDLFVPPPLALWPEIDVDALLPWNRDMEYMMDDGKSPAVWPIDYAFALPCGDRGIRIAICKTADSKKLRGVSRRFAPWNVEIYQVTIDQFGSVSAFGGGAFGRFNKQWVSLLFGGNYAYGCTTDRFGDGPSIAIGGALRTRYEWAAVFSFASGIRLRFGCSAEGALALFNDRDKPEEGRRPALLHWVRRHWRKTSDVATARAVRKHLRGITQVSWRGMDVSIIPSEFDIEQVAA